MAWYGARMFRRVDSALLVHFLRSGRTRPPLIAIKRPILVRTSAFDTVRKRNCFAVRKCILRWCGNAIRHYRGDAIPHLATKAGRYTPFSELRRRFRWFCRTQVPH